MSSMRRLTRRLHRWRRYANKTYWSPRVSRPAWAGPDLVIAPGHQRAWRAVSELWERRSCQRAAIEQRYDRYDEPDDDSDRCCLSGDYGHEGPCAWQCSTCDGYRRCPECGGEDDLGCHECGGTGSCWECHGDGEIVEDVYVGPSRPMETVTPVGGIL